LDRHYIVTLCVPSVTDHHHEAVFCKIQIHFPVSVSVEGSHMTQSAANESLSFPVSDSETVGRRNEKGGSADGKSTCARTRTHITVIVKNYARDASEEKKSFGTILARGPNYGISCRGDFYVWLVLGVDRRHINTLEQNGTAFRDPNKQQSVGRCGGVELVGRPVQAKPVAMARAIALSEQSPEQEGIPFLFGRGEVSKRKDKVLGATPR
jgi:hypothetical protein